MNSYAYPHAPTGWVDPSGLTECGGQRNAKNWPEPRERISAFKVIKEELPKWWMSDQVADLRNGSRLTIDMVAIPVKSVRLVSDGLSAGDILSDVWNGDYSEATVGAVSLISGNGAGHFLKSITKNDPVIRGVGTGAQLSTSEILKKDCFSCESE